MSITYFVSSVNGNDNNIGTNDGSPLKTTRKAYDLARDGDVILLKAGERFTDAIIGNEYGAFDKSNITIGKYGNDSAPNPLIRAENRGGDHIRFQGDRIIENVIVTDLDFRAVAPADPYNDKRGAPITAYARGNGWVLKNIKIEGYAGGMNISGEEVGDIQNCLFENITINKTYARLSLNANNQVERTHSGGFFLSKTTGTILRKCAALRCGWIPESNLYIPTIYNQGFYMHASNSNLLLDNCTAMMCAAGGIQLRGNTQNALNCISIGCPVGIGGGNKTDYNSTGLLWKGYIRGCIAWNTDDVTPSDPTDSGRMGSPPHKPAIGIAVNFSDGAIVENNYCLNGTSAEGNGAAIQIGERTNNTNIVNNKCYDWKGSIVTATHSTTNTFVRNNMFAGKNNQVPYSGNVNFANFSNNRWVGCNPSSSTPDGFNEQYNDGMYYDFTYGVDAYYYYNGGFQGSERAAWTKAADEHWDGKSLNIENVKNWIESMTENI